VVEVTGDDSPKMVPGTAGPSKPEGLAFDKSISCLLYLGDPFEIGHMASTRGP
jgi:hypothetical protein